MGKKKSYFFTNQTGMTSSHWTLLGLKFFRLLAKIRIQLIVWNEKFSLTELNILVRFWSGLSTEAFRMVANLLSLEELKVFSFWFWLLIAVWSLSSESSRACWFISASKHDETPIMMPPIIRPCCSFARFA